MPSHSLFGLAAIVFGMVFELWPASLLFSLIWPGNRFRSLLVMWGFWVLVRLLLLAYPGAYAPSYGLIGEPLSTGLLLASGPLLAAAWLLRDRIYQNRLKTPAESLDRLRSLSQITLPQRQPAQASTQDTDAHRVVGQVR